MLKELYEYRELLLTNTKKAIRGKYKASFLGILWSFINPLLQILVYAILFPYLMRNTVDNYLVYLVTGIIPWTFFTTVILDCVSCIKNNAGLIKKVYFPRIILPLSCTLSALFNFFVSCIIIVVFCLVWGVGISWLIVFVPLIALWESDLCFLPVMHMYRILNILQISLSRWQCMEHQSFTHWISLLNHLLFCLH